LEARVALPRLSPIEHRVRLLLHPFVGAGRPSCQTVEVAVNEVPVTTVWLDTGWRWYEMAVPARAFTDAAPAMRFRFARAERPGDHGLPADPRQLSVAFAVLQVIPGGRGR
jgi:hypothetical protein